VTWYAWAMVVVLVLGAAATISAIGRPREPLTPGLALAVCASHAMLVWGIVSLAAHA